MEPLLAEIKIFAGNFAPLGWFMCEGQTLSISQYSALFSLLGTTYGGDGMSNFKLPDLRGRMPIHPGSGPGLPDYQLGEAGGSPTTTLNAANVPPHTHPVTITAQLQVSDQNPNSEEAAGSYLTNTNGNQIYNTAGVNGLSLNGLTVTGTALPNAGGQPFNSMPPYLAMYYIIAWTGIYPSRP